MGSGKPIPETISQVKIKGKPNKLAYKEHLPGGKHYKTLKDMLKKGKNIMESDIQPQVETERIDGFGC